MNNAPVLTKNRADEPVQVIAVTSGKGGVGKTTVAVNLATALANRGHRVMLLDGDAGLAGVEVALGLRPVSDLGDVMRGREQLNNILIKGASGVSIVPTVSGSRSTAVPGGVDSATVIAAFDQLTHVPDVLIVDTATGIAEGVQCYAQAASDVLVLLGPESTAVRNAYTLIRVLHARAGVSRFRVLVNNVVSDACARGLFSELSRQVDQDMSVALHFIGHVPKDSSVNRSLSQQAPVVNQAPRSGAARAFKELARRTEAWVSPTHNEGGLNFFVERLMRRNNNYRYPGISNHQQGREVA